VVLRVVLLSAFVRDDTDSCLSPSRVYVHTGALAATGNALTLEKALRQRMWPGSGEECRQLPNIGKLLGSRLAANGMGSLRALHEADPRKIEAATQRNYPFGGSPILHIHSHLMVLPEERNSLKTEIVVF
jgi:hypothetical protein